MAMMSTLWKSRDLSQHSEYFNLSNAEVMLAVAKVWSAEDRAWFNVSTSMSRHHDPRPQVVVAAGSSRRRMRDDRRMGQIAA